MRRSALSFLALGALQAFASAQCPLVDVTKQRAGHIFNRTMDRVADVTGDGVPDLAIGDPRSNTNQGAVDIVSGATGATVFTIAAPAGAVYFGSSVASLGDVNGDGSPDLAIGMSGSTAFPKGAVLVFSLVAPSTPILTMSDATMGTFGQQVVRAGDVDGDGITDVLVAATHVALNGGEVQIRSGANGSLIRSLQSGPLGEPGGQNQQFGTGLAGGADVNGDGVPDVVVGAPFFKPNGTILGRVKVYSGATGAVLRTAIGTPAFANYGASADFVPDLDGDGVADIVIGGPISWDTAAPVAGVRIESGATGGIVRVHPGMSNIGKLGYSVRSVGDIDGDGVGDYGAIALPYTGFNCASQAIIWSGATGATIVSLARPIGSQPSATDEYFLAFAPLADLDGDGVADVAVLSESSAFGPTTNSRLRVVRAHDSAVTQATIADGCSSNVNTRPTLIVSGCVEPKGVLTIDANTFGIDSFLIASANTGNVVLPSGCAITVGFPAVLVRLIPNKDGLANLSTHLPAFGGPTTIHLQVVSTQNQFIGSSVVTNLATSGRATISIP